MGTLGAAATAVLLGEQLGTTFQQIQKYEAGHSRLSAGRLREVAIALNKPIEFFYEPFDVELEHCEESERKLKIRDLQRDAKRLIEMLGDLDDLQDAVHLLAAMKPRQTASC